MEWEQMIQIDNEWLGKFLNDQHFVDETKVKVRGYSIKFSGNLLDFNAITKFLAKSIHKFVYSSKYIGEVGELESYIEAQKYFGKKNPKADGKYGELLLFAFVEGVLKCPMVAHKIKSLSNPMDQVKGGDGIFLGNYEYQKGHLHSACLIGESKIMEDFSTAVSEAYISLDRFHNEVSSTQFSTTEFMVAKQNLSDDFDIDYVFDALKPGTEVFQNNILVHPILLMYNTNKINNIEKQALTPKMAEELVQEYFIQRGNEHLDLIKEKLEKWHALENVYLDFFIVPVNNVQKFRNSLYYHIHGVSYE